MDLFTTAIAQGLAFSGLAIGIFISLRVLNLPDITTDGSFVAGAAVTAILLSSGYHPLLCIPASIAAGAVAGFLTGIIHTRLGVNALLSGIIVMTGLYSVNLVIMGRPNIPLIGTYGLFDLVATGNNNFINKLIILISLAVIFAALVGWLLKTDFGIALRALGNSETMLRANGVNTRHLKTIGLAIANSFTALSGCLIAQYQGYADINMGIGIVISGLGAVMIGEAMVTLSGSGKIAMQIAGVILGVILFRMILGMALALGLNPNYLKAITALIVLVIVALTGLYKQKAND